MIRTQNITPSQNDLSGKYRPDEIVVASVEQTADYALYLPDATGATDTVFWLYPKSNGGTVTLTPRSGQTIGGKETRKLSGFLSIVSDGDNWLVSKRPAEVHVDDFGADPTGEEDSTDAINAATATIYASLASAEIDWTGPTGVLADRVIQGGGIVVFTPGGKYKVSSPINLYPMIAFEGNWALLQWAADASADKMIQSAYGPGGSQENNAYNIRRLVLDGNGIATNGVYIERPTISFFENVIVTKCAESGFVFVGGSHNSVNRCMSSLNGEYGFWLKATTGNVGCSVYQLRSCYAVMNTSGAYRASAASTCVFDGCKAGGGGTDSNVVIFEKEDSGNVLMSCGFINGNIEPIDGNDAVLVKIGAGAINTLIADNHFAGGTTEYRKWISNSGTNTIVRNIKSTATARPENPDVPGDYSLIECNGGSLWLLGYYPFAAFDNNPLSIASDESGSPAPTDEFHLVQPTDDGVVLSSAKVEGPVTIKETTTPTAKADYGKIYTKSDNKLYFQDGAGTEHEIAFV